MHRFNSKAANLLPFQKDALQSERNLLPLGVSFLRSLVPDGRIFGQITQKRPQKIVHGRKKLEAVKWQNLEKSGRKEAGKYFYKYLGEKPYDIL
jgi:hypothetical protein